MNINPKLLQPTILMDTDTAISVGTEITLNDNYSNYKYIDVYSSLWNSTFINFTRICTDWKYIEINMVNTTNNGATEHAVAVGELTGTKLKINRFSGFSISSSQAISNLTASPTIRKIVGYK